MALPSERLEYRIALQHVDRGLEANETVVIAQHPSESAEHATLRVLAWCLLYEERLAFGPGLADPDGADLWTHDLTGRLVTWVECGAVAVDKLRKILAHHSGVAAHAVFAGARRRDELVAERAADGRALKGAVQLWIVDAVLCSALAARAARRQRWSVTIVGDHLYVDGEGGALDGAVERGHMD
jgi:uncharacterized protein YaeQ